MREHSIICQTCKRVFGTSTSSPDGDPTECWKCMFKELTGDNA